MSTIVKNITGLKTFILVALALLFLSFAAVISISTNVKADNAQVLQAETTRLEQEIAQNEAYIQELQEQANTLQVKIDQLDAEILGEQKKIELTKNNIKELEQQIKETEAELNRQKDILRHALITLYKEGNITTIELLASSESYTDFINQQEYLSRIKDQIHESAKKVEDLKHELEGEKDKQDELLLELEARRDQLASKRNEQNRLLEQTEGEEARYQSIVADLQAQKEEAEAALNAYLASLINNSVSLGPVSRGEVIGQLGNTGYSTGPHVHFKIYSPQTVNFGVDPVSAINDNGWEWPVSGGGIITQSWGCSYLGVYPWNPDYGCPFHDAIDVAAPEGTPLVAVADGDIIHRGCLYTGTIFSTMMVVIDHHNGYYSSYAHMVAPSGSEFDACRANTYY